MTARRTFSTKVKLAAFQRAAGRCEKCTSRLSVGKFQFDHVIADAMGGEPTLKNCEVLCLACHGEKTAGSDIPAIAKVNQCNFGCWQKGTQEATAEDEMELHELCRADRCQYAKESATPEFTCREHCVYLEG